MARIKDTSVAEVKAAADIVDVVSGRTSLRKVSNRYTGRCPFHEERTPSFSVDPVEKLYYCFGCGKGGDVVRFVQETREPRLRRRDRVARRSVPRHPRVRGVVAAAGRGAAATRAPDRACSTRRRRTSSGCSGSRSRRAGAGVPRRPRPRRARSRASSGSASRRARGSSRRRASAGSRSRRSGGRAREPARQRLLPVPADVPAHRRTRPRGRLPGPSAARRRPAARASTSTRRESELFKKGNVLYGLHLGASGDREAGSRDRRRGQYRRDRAAAGRGRARRRVDGHGADRELSCATSAV